MQIGILGTGMVGTTLSGLLIKNGHGVMMGSRIANPEKEIGSFKDAAVFGDLLLNCTRGIASPDAIRLAGIENFDNKILVDVANPVDFSNGLPPRLTVCNDDSLSEEIQRILPLAKVVKALNTVNADIMVNPRLINNGRHDTFICGDHEDAKKTVTEFLIKELGWNRENIIDLGGIIHARTTESLFLFAMSLAMKYGSFYNSIKIHRA
jgi:predicted dinucleotide-binding enzyme